MRVLFLDFDGVLNSSAFFQRTSGRSDGLSIVVFSGGQFDPDAIQRLNRVVERAGCDVVVSSSWRLAYKRTQLCDMLRELGFAGRIVGVTPNLMADSRCEEIAAWLADHDVERFAIVDDDHTAGVGFAPQFVWTSFATGLDDAAADKLIAILTRDVEG